MLITDAVPKPTFSRHETFHLRYGWLKKAYNQVTQDRQIFLREDAPIKLGVGKNMVHAIKFWSMANKIIAFENSTKNSKLHITPMGDYIFGDKGVDPYLEKPDTLWLLHWLLFAPPCYLPVWWIIMNEFTATNIKISEMTESIITRITNIPDWTTPSPKSIKKDVDVFIHTYTTRQDKLSMEDYLDCPFRQLLMVKQNSREAMRFVFGKKHGLSPLITAFACLDFISHIETNAKSMSVSRLTTELGGVGHIFKINETELGDLLKEACNVCDIISMQNVNGAPHLTFDSARDDSIKILNLVYDKKFPASKQQLAKMESWIS